MLGAAVLDLFGRMPREVGNPYRWQINSLGEFENFVGHNNGINNTFVSVYPSNFLIDKIFFDNDFGDFVLEDTKQMVEWMLDKKYEIYVLISGKKGFHIYMKLHPKIYGTDAKMLLTKATYSVLNSIFGDFKQETAYIDGKQKRILRTKKRIIAPDPKVIGDVRRLARVPNTLRPPENINYCTFVNPKEFLEMSQSDIAMCCKYTSNICKNGGSYEYPTLLDFDYQFPKSTQHSSWPTFKIDKEISSNPSLVLKGILRPCLYHNIIRIHPSHDVRVAATVDLLRAGYSASYVTILYSTLGWEDFNEEKTLEQVKSCSGLMAYSCSKLRNLDIPTMCCVY